MRALSPAVLRRYVQYLAKHRKQANGNLRAFDNWKNGIPQDTYLDSLLRHTWDAWLTYNGEETSEPTTLEDLLCAIIFNANGLLFELLAVKGGATREHCTEPPFTHALADVGNIVVDDHPDRSRCTRAPITDPACLLPKPRTCKDCTVYQAEVESIPDLERPLSKVVICGECDYFDLSLESHCSKVDHCNGGFYDPVNLCESFKPKESR
jgi:hypothetical protein